jgi:UDP-N-acetylglucosamine 2-epimerase
MQGLPYWNKRRLINIKCNYNNNNCDYNPNISTIKKPIIYLSNIHDLNNTNFDIIKFKKITKQFINKITKQNNNKILYTIHKHVRPSVQTVHIHMTIKQDSMWEYFLMLRGRAVLLDKALIGDFNNYIYICSCLKV